MVSFLRAYRPVCFKYVTGFLPPIRLNWGKCGKEGAYVGSEGNRRRIQPHRRRESSSKIRPLAATEKGRRILMEGVLGDTKIKGRFSAWYTAGRGPFYTRCLMGGRVEAGRERGEGSP